MTYEEMGAAAEELLGVARRLSRGDVGVGQAMLLLAAASIARDRGEFLGHAEYCFDELSGAFETNEKLQ